MASNRSDGDLDTAFGSGGIVTTLLSATDSHARALALQSDGKILAAGRAYVGTQSCFAVARYAADGSLDTTFGAGGGATIAFGSYNSEALAVVVQADGRIILAGYDYNAGHQRFALTRLTSAGALDTSFGTSGRTVLQIENASFANAMVQDSSGRLILGGYAMPLAEGGTWNFALARFTANGVLDTAFGSDGVTLTNLAGGTDERIQALALQSDGRIIAAGYFTDSSTSKDFAVARYTTAGALDTTFNTTGYRLTPISSGEDWANSVLVQGSGRIVAAGRTYGGSTANFALAGYTSTGALDGSFGSSGVVTTDIQGQADQANCLVLQNDGKLLAGGTSNAYFAFARYSANGALDTAFGTDGTLLGQVPPVDSGTNAIYAMTVQSNGRIVAAGSYTLSSVPRFALVRFYP